MEWERRREEMRRGGEEEREGKGRESSLYFRSQYRGVATWSCD